MAAEEDRAEAKKQMVLVLLTLDGRHFRALTGAGGRPFRILPAAA